MWEYSKSTQIPSLELYIEEIPLGNVVASYPSPTPMPISTQETQNLFVPSPSCTASQPPPNQVSSDAVLNIGESDDMGP